MTVVPLFPRGDGANCRTTNGRTWGQHEMQRLMALHAAHAAHGTVADWEVGTTECDDPQFFLIAPGPEAECVMSLSRVGGLYVLQDRNGAVLAEDAALQPVTEAASRILAGSGRVMPIFAMRILFAFCAVRALIEQKLEPMLEESTEMLVRVAPFLANYV